MYGDTSNANSSDDVNLDLLLRNIKRARRRLMVSVAGFVGMQAALAMLTYWLRHNDALHIICVTANAIFTIVWAFAYITPVEKSLSTLRKHLASMQNLRALDALLEAVGGGVKEVLPTLTGLLDSIRASDAPTIPPTTRSKMHRRLKLQESYWSDGTFNGLTLAILRALQQIGDATSIAPVEWLHGETANKEIRSAAEECLLFLRQRTEEQRAANGLLRPADHTITPDVLLRPVVNTADAAPEQLLRATHNTGTGQT